MSITPAVWNAEKGWLGREPEPDEPAPSSYKADILGPDICALMTDAELICYDCLHVGDVDDYVASWARGDVHCGEQTAGMEQECSICGDRINEFVTPTEEVRLGSPADESLCDRCSTPIGDHIPEGADIEAILEEREREFWRRNLWLLTDPSKSTAFDDMDDLTDDDAPDSYDGH